MSVMVSPTRHPGWLALGRVAGHMVPCPRCKATFPARATYWRWTGEQWLCRRNVCVKDGEDYRGEPTQDLSELWNPLPGVGLSEMRRADREPADAADAYLIELGLK